MVKNIDSEGDRKDVGPDCQVRECRHPLISVNDDLEPREISIEQADWEQPNTWIQGRTEGPRRLDPRLMDHTETSYRYNSITDDADYGKIELID